MFTLNLKTCYTFDFNIGQTPERRTKSKWQEEIQDDQSQESNLSSLVSLKEVR